MATKPISKKRKHSSEKKIKYTDKSNNQKYIFSYLYDNSSYDAFKESLNSYLDRGNTLITEKAK